MFKNIIKRVKCNLHIKIVLHSPQLQGTGSWIFATNIWPISREDLSLI